MSKVIVTGANGYMAQYIIDAFLKAGFNVIGTVRSHSKGERISSKFQNKAFQYDVIESLNDYEQVSKSIIKHQSNLKYFIHPAASSNLFTKDSEHDMLIPNVESTRAILNALHDHADPVFEKLVYTSSISTFNKSVMGFEDVTEESWNPITYDQGKLNGFLGYTASKKYSELEILNFVKENNPPWSTVILGLSMVIGTPFFANDPINNAAKLLLRPLKAGPNDTIDPLNFLTVTVEDVAKAHLVSATSDKIKNERLLLSSNRLDQQDVLDAGNEVLELKGKIQVGTPRTEPISLVTNVKNSKTLALLGFQPECTLTNLKKVVKYVTETNQF